MIAIAIPLKNAKKTVSQCFFVFVIFSLKKVIVTKITLFVKNTGRFV